MTINITPLKNGLKRMLNAIAYASQQTSDYFRSGSFGMAVYPYLMHPCFDKMLNGITALVAVLTAFGGVFYLFGEHVAILFSERGITTYFHHSVLELFFPIGTMLGDYENKISNLPQVMRAAFSYQGYLFIWLYFLGIYRISERRYWVLSALLALCFSIGAFLVSDLYSASYNQGGLHNFGASLTFLIGNLTLIMVGFDISSARYPKFKRRSLWLGVVGSIAIIVSMTLPTIFTPMIERVGIYSIMLWEIFAGFTLLKISK